MPVITVSTSPKKVYILYETHLGIKLEPQEGCAEWWQSFQINHLSENMEESQRFLFTVENLACFAKLRKNGVAH